MSIDIALQVGLLCVFLIGLLLWLASPTGRPWDGQDCPIKDCKWHRGSR